MKNSSDTIGNRTRDLPTCSAVPQPTALQRAPKTNLIQIKLSVLPNFNCYARYFNVYFVYSSSLYFIVRYISSQNLSCGECASQH